MEIEKADLLKASSVLAMRSARLVRLVKMMLDGYKEGHPLPQKVWESGVAFTAQKEIMLVLKAIKNIEPLIGGQNGN